MLSNVAAISLGMPAHTIMAVSTSRYLPDFSVAPYPIRSETSSRVAMAKPMRLLRSDPAHPGEWMGWLKPGGAMLGSHHLSSLTPWACRRCVWHWMEFGSHHSISGWHWGGNVDVGSLIVEPCILVSTLVVGRTVYNLANPDLIVSRYGLFNDASSRRQCNLEGIQIPHRVIYFWRGLRPSLLTLTDRPPGKSLPHVRRARQTRLLACDPTPAMTNDDLAVPRPRSHGITNYTQLCLPLLTSWTPQTRQRVITPP